MFKRFTANFLWLKIHSLRRSHVMRAAFVFSFYLLFFLVCFLFVLFLIFLFSFFPLLFCSLSLTYTFNRRILPTSIPFFCLLKNCWMILVTQFTSCLLFDIGKRWQLSLWHALATLFFEVMPRKRSQFGLIAFYSCRKECSSNTCLAAIQINKGIFHLVE